MSSAPTRCQPRTLAQNGPVRIDLCGCGQVHVSFGPFTLRLGRDQYLLLCDALLDGACRLPESGGAAVH